MGGRLTPSCSPCLKAASAWPERLPGRPFCLSCSCHFKADDGLSPNHGVVQNAKILSLKGTAEATRWSEDARAKCQWATTQRRGSVPPRGGILVGHISDIRDDNPARCDIHRTTLAAGLGWGPALAANVALTSALLMTSPASARASQSTPAFRLGALTSARARCCRFKSAKFADFALEELWRCSCSTCARRSDQRNSAASHGKEIAVAGDFFGPQ